MSALESPENRTPNFDWVNAWPGGEHYYSEKSRELAAAYAEAGPDTAFNIEKIVLGETVQIVKDLIRNHVEPPGTLSTIYRTEKAIEKGHGNCFSCTEATAGLLGSVGLSDKSYVVYEGTHARNAFIGKHTVWYLDGYFENSIPRVPTNRKSYDVASGFIDAYGLYSAELGKEGQQKGGYVWEVHSKKRKVGWRLAPLDEDSRIIIPKRANSAKYQHVVLRADYGIPMLAAIGNAARALAIKPDNPQKAAEILSPDVVDLLQRLGPVNE